MRSRMLSTNSFSDDGAGFLSELDSSIKRFPYKGKESCLRTVDEEFEKSRKDSPANVIEWILFTGVDEKTFTREFLTPSFETDPYICDWTCYDNTNGFLLFRMLSRPHEVAAARFELLLERALESMGLDSVLQTFSSSTTNGPTGKKQADGSWAPRRLPRDRSNDWPSLVLEVALSQGESKLISDVRFWLHQSNGDVKIALTLEIYRHRPEIVLEKWDLRQGRRYRAQQVTMSKGMGANKHITVSGAPLVIEFDKLLLRPPTIPRETNIQLDTESLKMLAILIWEQQDFVAMGTELEDFEAS